MAFSTAVLSRGWLRPDQGGITHGFDPFVVSKDTYETRTFDVQEIHLVPLHVVCLAV